MATKSSKKSTVTSSSTTTSSVRDTHTPQPSTSSPQGRPGSPLSPTRYSRLQEKADLQNLNDRLACYIDRVRHLEAENSRLTREVQSTQETVTREVTSIKSMYENELADARKLLDETARERAKLEIDVKRLWEENDDLKFRLDKKTKDLGIAEKSLSIYESRVSDLSAKYNQAVADRKKATDEVKELEKECEKLRKQVEDLRKHLEDETLARIDLENNVQSLREELQFKEQVYNQELTETRTRRQVEISEIDGRLTEQYEAKMQQSLHELRDQYEAQMRANRDEIELLYENKIKNLTNQAQRNSGAATVAVDELRQARSRLDAYNSKIGELESSNAALLIRVRDLEKMLDLERQHHAEERAALELELQQLRDEMANQLQEYQDLMDIKVALDLEITAYRKLLESEEARLNISPTQSPNVRVTRGTPVRRTPVRGGKRKRTTLEESEESSTSNYHVTSHAKGEIEVSDVCADGKYVKLHNKGSKEVVLSGWQLIRRAGDLETSFKFHRSVKIEPGANVTVWSSDLGQTHEPPYNIVMKGQKWFVADSMTTTLLNNTGEEMAVSERRRQQLSSSSSRHREVSGFLASHRSLDIGSEDLYHQQGDPQGEDRCKIM
ncbi:lamin Dm0-like [Zootermopsis nevadensis]|uniref:Lamin Dm0 n=1 Tax=Zootermopsis nevadensis TaxID=136037 RepID=A0A067R8L2_ZOONE|nr:lamin Dm0-like [Zootermopsis nevadensis]KDR19813.1 Lamin Dm0 [Zootermopsis nevadensis]